MGTKYVVGGGTGEARHRPLPYEMMEPENKVVMQIKNGRRMQSAYAARLFRTLLRNAQIMIRCLIAAPNQTD